MAVWLLHEPVAVGIDDGVIRARDFASLVDASDVLTAAHAQREHLLARAREQADAALATAREEAASLVAEAQSSFEAAYRQGLERGLHDAATQWASQAIEAADIGRRSLYRQSERLSSLVSMAVERVIDQADRVDLFRRSLRTVVKLVKNVPMLTMRVNADDCVHAQRAIDEFLPDAGSALAIEVVADPALAPGACRFESDNGIVDASLDTQLAALRSAVHRAAGQMVLEGENESESESDVEPIPEPGEIDPGSGGAPDVAAEFESDDDDEHVRSEEGFDAATAVD